MNDRFKFRWPLLEDKTNKFIKFVYSDCFGGKHFDPPKKHFGEPEQCTGLKDKNGNLIYEGDIMEHRIYFGKPELYIVKWSESVNGWVYQDAKNSLSTSYILTEFADSIIGNIHENKELLDER